MKRALILLPVLAVVVACATSPLGRRQFIMVSDGEMVQMGVASFADMKKKMPAAKDPKVVAYVNCVARNVTSVMPSNSWEVQVFEDKNINAFALPGGKIGVFTGLLKAAQNQDQLAAVIGHEVAHVIAGHSAERMSEQMATQMGGAVVQSTTGIDPQVLGLDYMAKAGFDPRQAPVLWQNMAATGGEKPPEVLSTHPSDQTRIAGLNKRLKIAMPLYEQAQASGKKPACKL